MPFQPGNKLAGNRKGIPNKKSVSLEELCEKRGINPFEELLKLCGEDTHPDWRIPALREACKYLYSQKKAVEITNGSSLDGLTPQQKLEALRKLVELTEREVQEVGANAAIETGTSGVGSSGSREESV